jgi:hypothetical protein
MSSYRDYTCSIIYYWLLASVFCGIVIIVCYALLKGAVDMNKILMLNNRLMEIRVEILKGTSKPYVDDMAKLYGFALERNITLSGKKAYSISTLVNGPEVCESLILMVRDKFDVVSVDQVPVYQEAETIAACNRQEFHEVTVSSAMPIID